MSPLSAERSEALTRAYYAPTAGPSLATLEDIGFSMIAMLVTMLVGAIAFA